MYIAVKQRDNKQNERVFYLYLCQSKRAQGKVTNKQQYLVSVKEKDLINDCYKEKFKTKFFTLKSEEKQLLDNKVKSMLECLSS